MCFAESGPGGKHVDFETYRRMVDRYVSLEGVADVLQLSGGEPTLHPELVRMVRYAYEQPIQAVMINTNGVRLAHDPALVEQLATMRDRLEIYLQFDGLEDAPTRPCAASRCWKPSWPRWRCCDGTTCAARWSARWTTTSTCTKWAACLRFGLERPIVRGVSFQLATYCGRHLEPGRPGKAGHDARCGQGGRRPDGRAGRAKATSTRCLVRIRIVI